MHPRPGNWVAIGHVVVNSARAAHAFSAEIKCRHCMARKLGGIRACGRVSFPGCPGI